MVSDLLYQHFYCLTARFAVKSPARGSADLTALSGSPSLALQLFAYQRFQSEIAALGGAAAPRAGSTPVALGGRLVARPTTLFCHHRNCK